MKKMPFLLLLVFLFPITAFSQLDQCYLWANPDQDGVVLRWTFCIDSVLPSNSYTILRREKDQSDYVAIGTSSAISIDKWREFSTINSKTLDTIRRLIDVSVDSRKTKDVRKKAFISLQKLHLLRPEQYARLFGLFFVDTTASSKKSYDYKIEYNQKEVAQLENVSLRYLEAKTVRNFQVQSLTNAIRLQWKLFNDFPRGILGYIVYKKSPETFDFIRQPQIHYVFNSTDTELLDFTIEDRNVFPGVRYTYAITPIDVFGREGLRSDTMSVIARSTDDDKIPNNFIASFVGDSVVLSWEKPKVPLVNGYHIYRYPTNNKEEKVRITKNPINADTKSFVDKPMGQLTDFFSYVITTINNNGVESATSSEQKIALPNTAAPDMPNYLTTQGIRKGIILSWQRSKAKDVIGYELFRSESEDGEFYPVETMVVKDTFYVDIIASNEKATTFWYQVRAVDRFGNKSSLTLVTPGFAVGSSTPKSVQLQDAFIKEDKVVLQWTNEQNQKTQGFWVNRYNDTSYSPITINSALIIGNEFVDSSMLNKQQYWYEVIAVDSNFNYSQPSNRVFVDLRKTYSMKTRYVDTAYIQQDTLHLYIAKGVTDESVELMIELAVNVESFTSLAVIQPYKVTYFALPIEHKEQVLTIRIRKRDGRSPWQKPEDSQTITLENIKQTK